MSDLLTKDEIKQYMLLLDNLPEDSPQVDKVWGVAQKPQAGFMQGKLYALCERDVAFLYWGQAPQDHGGCL
jgi:hypothetical protein